MWVDLDEAYWTMAPGYVESVWWSLKSLFERGLLQEADKVTAYCPRCGTALSDAEVAHGYQTVEDPSVFVRFPIVEADDASLVGASLVVWTTTPWTLPSNTGLAVDAGRGLRRGRARRRAARSSVRRCAQPSLGEGGEVVRTIAGSALVGARYEPALPQRRGRPRGRRRRLRLDGRRHRHRAHRAGVRRRTTSRSGAPRDGPCTSRSATTAGSPTSPRSSSAACS